MSGKGGGRLFAAIDGEHLSWADAQPMVAGCAFCGWRFEGSVGEGRAAAAAHRQEAHPERARSVGRKRPSVIPMAPVVDPVALTEGRARGALVAAMHERRGGLGEGEPIGEREPAAARTAASVSLVSQAAAPTAEPASPSPSPTAATPYALQKHGRGYVWTHDAALASVRDFHKRHGRWPGAADAQQARAGTLVKCQYAIHLFGGWKLMLAAAHAGLGRAHDSSSATAASQAAEPQRDAA